MSVTKTETTGKTREQNLEDRLLEACKAFQEQRNKRIPTNVYIIIENNDVPSIDYTHIYTAKKNLSSNERKSYTALSKSFGRIIRQHSINLLKK